MPMLLPTQCEHSPTDIIVGLDNEDVMMQWCQHCGATRYVIKGDFRVLGERTRAVPDTYLPWEMPKHFGLAVDPASKMTEEEMRMAAEYKISAIKKVRERTGYGLKESKDLVEAYLTNKDLR